MTRGTGVVQGTGQVQAHRCTVRREVALEPSAGLEVPVAIGTASRRRGHAHRQAVTAGPCPAFPPVGGVEPDQVPLLENLGDPTVAVGLELNVIAAVVIGGGSLSGGEGSILGTLVGALIMTVIASGCTQRGYPNWVQEIITGAIIVIAVALDRLRHRKTA